jgi:predicted transcriptional regulator
LYGVKVSYPRQVNADILQDRTDLLSAAAFLWKSLNQKIAMATKKLEQASTETESNKQVNRLTEAAKAILGDDFMVFPLFAYSNPEDLAKTLLDKGDQLLKHINQLQGSTNELAIETWMESVSRVRPHMSRLEQIRMISEAQQEVETIFQAAQVPFKEKNSWLAVEFPAIDEITGERFDILDDTIALAIHGESANKVNEPQSALLIDEWTESIPNDKEITGVSFNYDQPNATAPNALLLAIEPTGVERWNWDVLMGILQNTLERAKTRAVEPTQLMEDPALDTLLPMTVANFDLKEANISLDYLIASDKFSAFMANSTHELYKAWNA